MSGYARVRVEGGAEGSSVPDVEMLGTNISMEGTATDSDPSTPPGHRETVLASIQQAGCLAAGVSLALGNRS